MDKILIKIKQIEKQIEILENEKNKIKTKYTDEKIEQSRIEVKINECESKIHSLNSKKDTIEYIKKTKWKPKMYAVLYTISTIFNLLVALTIFLVLKENILLGIIFSIWTAISTFIAIDNFLKISDNKKFLKNNNIKQIENEIQLIANEKANYQKIYNKKLSYIHDLYNLICLKEKEINELTDNENSLNFLRQNIINDFIINNENFEKTVENLYQEDGKKLIKTKKIESN